MSSSRRGHNIRNGLVSDRERRRNRETECFGIYRPTFQETQAELGSFAVDTSDAITAMLARERERFARLKPKDDFAVTIAEYGNVNRRIANAIISGYEIGRLVDGLSEDILLDPLELSVSQVEWLKIMKRRKDARVLALKFEKDANFEKMAEQFKVIDKALARLGIYGAINEPEQAHVTILTYGACGDRMNMSKKQANEAIDIAETNRKAKRIGTVCVGPIVIGDGAEYRVNHPSISNRLGAMVPTV